MDHYLKQIREEIAKLQAQIAANEARDKEIDAELEKLEAEEQARALDSAILMGQMTDISHNIN